MRVTMLRKTLLLTASLTVVLFAVGDVLYIGNPPPKGSALSAAEAAGTGKPFVVKLHAQWCPVCMMTKDIWSEIAETYAGRVHLVVLDFTNQANADASRAEANRLGLQEVFDEYAGTTGTVLVLDGRTRKATASLHGSRDFSEYRAAIDAALTSH